MENTTEDQSVNNNALLKEFLLVVKQYYLNPDVDGKILEYSSIDLEIIENQLSLIREWVKIQKDLSRNQDGYPIVQKLQEIELKYYKPIIYKLVDKEDSTSLEDLQQLFEDLASLSSSIGDDYAEGSDISALKYYSDAAIFYQYQYAIKQKIASEEKAHIDYKNLNNLKQKMLTFINRAGETITQDIATEIEENKTKLVEIRSKTTRALTEINRLADENDNKNYIAESEALFLSIASDMKGFLNHLHEEAKKEIGLEPPCKYALIGLGSMALNQMTPYSDIEFAILTENNNYKDYFRNLSHLIHFKVINLGETIIPTSRYGLDMSNLVHPGVNFDLGGKTPLGRIDGDKPYDLIKTVEEMMWYVRNEDNKSEHIDKNLPFILEKVTYITGNERLVTDYQDLVSQFLQQSINLETEPLKNCQVRALKILQEGTVEFNYLQGDGKPLQIVNQGDLQRLGINLVETEGKFFDLKQEIYRLPDRLIYNLGLYYCIEGNSAWNTVSQLCNKDIISQKASENLSYAVTFANIVRLKNYMDNNGQIDYAPILNMRIMPALFEYFYTALPFHIALEEFCYSKNLPLEQKANFLQNLDFYKNNDLNKGLVFYRLGQYHQAIMYLESSLQQTESDITILDAIRRADTLINIYLKSDNTAYKAFEHINEIKELCCNSWLDNTVFDVMESIKLGQVCYALNKIEEAITLFKKVDILNTSDQYYYDLNVCAEFSLGLCYLKQKDYEDALTSFNKALEMQKEVNSMTKEIAGTYNSIGGCYLEQKNYEDALTSFNKALEIQKEVYQDELHQDIAGIYSNMGCCFSELGNNNEAIRYLEKALTIRRTLSCDQPNDEILDSIQNLGYHYKSTGLHNKALDYAFAKMIIEWKFIGMPPPNEMVEEFIEYTKPFIPYAIQQRVLSILSRKLVSYLDSEYVDMNILDSGQLFVSQLEELEQYYNEYEQSDSRNEGLLSANESLSLQINHNAESSDMIEVIGEYDEIS
ncbi:MAG: tetratricopeptide repeat protein [Rickettsiaceae bacterium]